MITMMPGVCKTVRADDVCISVGTEYSDDNAVVFGNGDHLVFSGGTPWVCVNDNTKQVYKANEYESYYVSPTYYGNYKQWAFDLGEDSAVLTGYYSTGDETITGFKCNGGNGSEGNPFTFELIGTYKATLSTTNGGSYKYKVNEESYSEDMHGEVKFSQSIGNVITAVATPEANFSFVGWYEATVDETGSITGHTDTLITDSTTIEITSGSQYKKAFAVFNDIEITYDANGGTTGSYWPTGNRITVPKNSLLKAADFWNQVDSGVFITAPEDSVVGSITITDSSGSTVIQKTDTTSTYTFTEDATIKFNWTSSGYSCKDGDGGSWTVGSSSNLDFTFDRINGKAKKEDLKGLQVDNTAVEKDTDYTVEDGSVIIKLQPSYLKGLSLGEHTLTAVFPDEKIAMATFTIKEKEEEKDKEEKKEDSSSKSTTRYTAPKTGVE